MIKDGDRMQQNILGLFETHYRQWCEREQRKKAVKKAYKDKLYPTFEDIYGKEVAKNER